jgi:hypothetical protein
MRAVEAIVVIPAVLIGIPLLVFGIMIALNFRGYTERRTRRNYERLRERMLVPVTSGDAPADVIARETRLTRVAGSGLMAAGLFLGVLVPLAAHAIATDSLF